MKNSGKKIIITVSNNLIYDQRVKKVAQTLFDRGYNITLLGRHLKDTPEFKRPYKKILFRLWFNKGALFYANLNLRLFFYLLVHRHQVILANDLDTLPAAYLAAIIRGKKLVFDSHELFTEVPELKNRPYQKGVWLFIQNRIVPKLKNNYTVCHGISKWYWQQYNTKFKVVRNLPVKQVFTGTKKQMKPVFLYQGSINLARGIELMIDAMEYVANGELWIIGDGLLKNKLQLRAKALIESGKVKFFDAMPPEKLKEFTVQASIGLSLEENMGLNYYYALPNKLFDYIQAGVPVLVSKLPEMEGVVKEYSIGEILHDRSPRALAAQMLDMLDEDKQKIWHEKLKKASAELIWEKEVPVLLDVFNKLD